MERNLITSFERILKNFNIFEIFSREGIKLMMSAFSLWIGMKSMMKISLYQRIVFPSIFPYS